MTPNVDDSSLKAPSGDMLDGSNADRTTLSGVGRGRIQQQLGENQQKLDTEGAVIERNGRGGSRRVAVAQMTAVGDVEKNYATCKLLVEVSLMTVTNFSIWLSLGGFQEAGGPDAGKRFFNTHVLVDDTGTIQAAYRKIHLFDVNVPGGPVLTESNSTLPGSSVVSAMSPVGRLGLTVCYDLRFPELYQRLRFDHHCDVLLIPAAFTQKTGEAHWEVLLRARAIECQCYVIAAAQAGRHNDLRDSYGHALVVDPWGRVAARCKDAVATGIATVDIDMDLIVSTRQPLQS
ncbi:unnamed protein product [Closterium sp. NIES-53]